MDEKPCLSAEADAQVIRRGAHAELLHLVGRYGVECRDQFGNIKWQDVIENLVTTVGKNLFLDSGLAGSSYTVTGPYMGLISSVGYSSIVAADTMASHAGWTEAGTTVNRPTYTPPRKTAVWSAGSVSTLHPGLNRMGSGSVSASCWRKGIQSCALRWRI